MSNITYKPGIGNAPFGNTNTNSLGSNYATVSGYSPQESALIQKALKATIFDAAPEQYTALKLLYAKSPEEVPLDEFSWLEKTFGRSPVESAGIVAAVAATPGLPATQVITLTAGSMSRISPDLIIIYPGTNSKAVIKSINTATNQITVESQTSDGLPAVAAGMVFSIQSTIIADAMDYFSNYDRMETVERYNFIQFFLRAQRWGQIEMQKFLNAGTTNYLDLTKKEKLEQIRIDLFNTFFNGQRGEFRISNNYVAKATGGIFPTMQAAGAMSGNPTLAGLASTFETLAFASNFKKEGATRFIYGTDEMLYDLSKVWKAPGLRYQPNDEIANLNLEMYKIGSMKFVPVSCELFREQSCFPKEWRRRLLVLDQETIRPMIMKGIPAMDMDQTDNMQNGTRENYTDFWVKAQLGVRYHNPIGGFWIDVR